MSTNSMSRHDMLCTIVNSGNSSYVFKERPAHNAIRKTIDIDVTAENPKKPQVCYALMHYCSSKSVNSLKAKVKLNTLTVLLNSASEVVYITLH